MINSSLKSLHQKPQKLSFLLCVLCVLCGSCLIYGLFGDSNPVKVGIDIGSEDGFLNKSIPILEKSKASRPFMSDDLAGRSVDTLFVIKGKPFNRKSLNKCVIALVMKNIRINKKVSCYTFHHSIASHAELKKEKKFHKKTKNLYFISYFCIIKSKRGIYAK